MSFRCFQVSQKTNENNSTLGTIGKFMFSKKATKIDEIFTVTVTTYCQIDGEDLSIFVAFSENVNFNEWKTFPDIVPLLLAQNFL